MIAWPKAAGRAISLAESTAMTSRSPAVRARPSASRRWARRPNVFSITTTAPSTIRPKSSAPRLIRLPLIPNLRMAMAAIRNDSGMTSAVIRAARKLPSAKNSTAMTSSAPTVRLCSTVRIVASTSRVRSSTGLMITSGGRLGAMALRRSSTRAATVRLFSPTSIKAVPITTSRPFSLAEPRRGAWPRATVATSETLTTAPWRRPIGVSASSARLLTLASVRTM